jgi:hypothetical protein
MVEDQKKDLEAQVQDAKIAKVLPVRFEDADAYVRKYCDDCEYEHEQLDYVEQCAEHLYVCLP